MDNGPENPGSYISSPIHLWAYLCVCVHVHVSCMESTHTYSTTESLEPVVSCAEVSSRDFDSLEEMIEEYHASISSLESACDSLKVTLLDSQFANILVAMEEYLACALKSTADALRYITGQKFYYTKVNVRTLLCSNEDGDKELSVVILADNHLLKLPLEAMKIFQQNNIISVSRDFSLQMLYHRILMFNMRDEEG